jgi:hypothetical protein
MRWSVTYHAVAPGVCSMACRRTSALVEIRARERASGF